MTQTRRSMQRAELERRKPMLIAGVTVVALSVTALIVLLGAQSRQAGGDVQTDLVGIEVGITADGFPYKGSPDAPVKLIEFSDYLCGHCRNFAVGTGPLIDDEYVATGKVQFIFHYYALGQAQILLGEASHCAADQGSFWDYHTVMFENQSRFREIDSLEKLQALLNEFAAQASLDVSAFQACWTSHQHQETIIQSVLSAREIGVGSTPTFSIQGELIVGNQPYGVFREAIDASLEKVTQ